MCLMVIRLTMIYFQVNCLADGVLVDIDLRDRNFNGVMYVKGHSNEERCRQAIDVQQTGVANIDFKVQFGTCGLFHNDVSCPMVGAKLENSCKYGRRTDNKAFLSF